MKYELAALDSAKAFIFFSDNAPEGLMDALDYQVPRQVAKLGMISASTPFVTGRPYTLFHDTMIYSKGAVGIALRSETAPQNEASFHGYIPISGTLQVTDARGNLLHKLNGENPTRTLLDRIEQWQRSSAAPPPVPAEALFLTKEDEFFVGVPFSAVDTEEPTFQRIYRITAGDPKKGTMSLDPDEGPPSGTRVQLLRRSGDWPRPVRSNVENTLLCQFQTTTDELVLGPDGLSQDTEDDELQVVENVFCTASEHGFVTSALAGMPSARGRCWRTSVLGSESVLSLR